MKGSRIHQGAHEPTYVPPLKVTSMSAGAFSLSTTLKTI